jgi:hypothetical protein
MSMPFRCPHCAASSGLEITDTIELPPDPQRDEMTFQVVACKACDFSGLAMYTESRRGALDAEAWEHTGYLASQEEVRQVRQAIRTCPRPMDSDCTCEAHKTMNERAGTAQRNPVFKLRMA